MIATRVAYGEALAALGEKNKDIVALDADLSCSTQTKMFADKFPERFFNVGIAEQNMMGISAGLAFAGKIPFASTFAIFATGRAYDQVRNGIAYPKANVKIVASHGGVSVGEDGASHQPLEDIGLMRGIPNMRVFVPADATETKQVINYVAKINGPCYVRTGRTKTPIIFDDTYKFSEGKAALVHEGSDVTIAACGLMVAEALTAAEELSKQSISARVLNMSSIKPFDTDAIVKAAKETGIIITAEEHSVNNGLGSAVCEAVSENCPCQVKRIGVNDEFGQSGTPKELLEHYGLTSAHIVKTILEVKK